MTKFKLIGGAIALSLSSVAFAAGAGCCADMACCKQGGDCCKGKDAKTADCCAKMKRDGTPGDGNHGDARPDMPGMKH